MIDIDSGLQLNKDENTIHPTAVIGKSVKLGTSNNIGPFCVIEDGATLSNNNTLLSNVVVNKGTKIGNQNTFHPFSVIGGIPQDKKFNGEETILEIGDNNIIREGVTLNIGTKNGGGITKIGNNCLLMANSHIGHDSILENDIVIANSVAIAGHVKIASNVLIGGNSAVHQFANLGRFAVVGGMSGITGDVPPFALAYGDRAFVRSINFIGLRRGGVQKEDVIKILYAYRAFYDTRLLAFADRMKAIESLDKTIYLNEIIDFMKKLGTRQLLKGKIIGETDSV